jgi:hypothetical protein
MVAPTAAGALAGATAPMLDADLENGKAGRATKIDLSLQRCLNDPFRFLKSREGFVTAYMFFVHVALLYYRSAAC